MGRMSLVMPSYPDEEMQINENIRATAALTELLENALTVAENYLAYTEGRLPPLAQKTHDLTRSSAEFNARYKHPSSCGWDETKTLHKCLQELTPTQLKEIHSRPVLDVDGIVNSLHQLCTTERIPRGRVLLLKDNLKVLNEHMGKVNNIVNNNNNNSNNNEAIHPINLSDALVALNEVHSVDVTKAIREEIAEMDVKKRKCEEEVKAAEIYLQSAQQSNDVIEVEKAHRMCIAAQYELMVFCAQRVHHLDLSQEDSEVNGFAEQLEQLKHNAQDAVQCFADEKSKMKDALESDLHKCNEAIEQAKTQQDEITNNYNKEAESKDAELAQNINKQKEIIELLRSKARELVSLMQAQKEMVSHEMNAKRVKEEQVTSLNEFKQLAQQHRQRLSACLDYYNRCNPLLPEMNQYVEKMISKLPMDEAQDAIKQLTDDEAQEFMKQYKKFAFLCGELSVKKAHRLDTLERQARLAQHNLTSAMDSLDPNLESYQAEMEEVNSQITAVEEVLQALNATQDAAQEVFESVESPILQMCSRTHTEFIHPLQELGIKAVDERSTFVDKSMGYVEEEEKEVSHKRTQLNEMKQLVLQEAERHGADNAITDGSAARKEITN